MLLHTHKDHTENINLLFFWSFLMFNNITELNIRSAPPPTQLKLHSYPSDSPEQLQSHLNQKKPLQKNLLHEGDEMSIKTSVHKEIIEK